METFCVEQHIELQTNKSTLGRDLLSSQRASLIQVFFHELEFRLNLSRTRFTVKIVDPRQTSATFRAGKNRRSPL